ncbi:MAG: hypothetical protein V3T72_05250 [Thermoanaerobaculia bacterium]
MIGPGNGPCLRAAIVALAGLLLLPLAAGAQDDEFVPDDEFIPEQESAPADDPANFQSIDDLLALDEEVLSDPGLYSYDPGARRDPFRSLLLRRSDDDDDNRDRPDGPAGLLIDEIAVEGVFILPEGPVAQVQSASQETSFLLRPGDQLWDGDVVRITLEEVVFKQTLNDPTALKPFREVVKRLTPQ